MRTKTMTINEFLCNDTKKEKVEKKYMSDSAYYLMTSCFFVGSCFFIGGYALAEKAIEVIKFI